MEQDRRGPHAAGCSDRLAGFFQMLPQLLALRASEGRRQAISPQYVARGVSGLQIRHRWRLICSPSSIYSTLVARSVDGAPCFDASDIQPPLPINPPTPSYGHCLRARGPNLLAMRDIGAHGARNLRYRWIWGQAGVARGILDTLQFIVSNVVLAPVFMGPASFELCSLLLGRHLESCRPRVQLLGDGWLPAAPRSVPRSLPPATSGL